VNAWSRGADFADLATYTTAAEGDMIRSLRMTIQILRELRRATDDEPLKRKLREAERAINRGAVDAERQLRAGCDAPAGSPQPAGGGQEAGGGKEAAGAADSAPDAQRPTPPA